MLELIEALPKNVVGIVATGRLTMQDCRDVLMPAIKHKIRLYYEINSRFPGSAWDDLDLGLEHAACCERVAIVTDIGQTNNVPTDDRGYIYIVDRANTGLHILRLTGAAREIFGQGLAAFPELGRGSRGSNIRRKSRHRLRLQPALPPELSCAVGQNGSASTPQGDVQHRRPGDFATRRRR
jgi:hypothetical protein